MTSTTRPPVNLHTRAVAMSSVRAGIGLASIFAPAVSARIAGYPPEHDNPTARMMARLFGVRELLLAWLVVEAVRDPSGPAPSVFAIQGTIDAADVAVQSWALLKRDGLNRGAAGGIVLAAGAAVLWGRLARQASRQAGITVQARRAAPV